MAGGFGRDLGTALASCALLLVGAALLLLGLYWVALAAGAFESQGQGRLALAVYYRVVVVKSLLPQLVLTLVVDSLWRRGRGGPNGGKQRLLELATIAALAYAVVAPLLLGRAFEGWPALEMKSPGDHVATFVSMTAVTVLCAWLPRARLRGPSKDSPAD